MTLLLYTGYRIHSPQVLEAMQHLHAGPTEAAWKVTEKPKSLLHWPSEFRTKKKIKEWLQKKIKLMAVFLGNSAFFRFFILALAEVLFQICQSNLVKD